MNKGAKILLAVAALAVAPISSVAADPALPNQMTPLLQLQASAVYNTNVADSSAALAAVRGLSRVDETYSPSINLNYFKQLGLESFSLAGQAGYDFYQRNTILNRERLVGESGLGFQVADCQGTAEGTYARRQNDLSELSVRTTENTEEDISVGLNAQCNPTGILSPSLSVTRSWSDNSEFLRFTSDYRSLATEGSIQYKQASLGTASLFGQYSETEFPRRLFATPSGVQEDGYNIYAGGARLEHQFGSYIDLQFSLSETALRANSQLGSNFNGITYDSILSYSHGERLQLKFEFSRKTNPSNRLDASYSVDQVLDGQADYALTSRLKLTLGASNIKSAYKGAALVAGTDLTKETRNSVFGLLGLDLTPRLSVNLTANHDQRHADVLGYGYVSTRFGLSISQAF